MCLIFSGFATLQTFNNIADFITSTQSVVIIESFLKILELQIKLNQIKSVKSN